MKNVKINRKTLPWLLFGCCCGAFLLFVVLTQVLSDRTPPEITVPETPLEVSVSAERTELLRDIKAVDKKDGDVTESLVVESVSGLDHGRATVTVAAFDGSGNVAKARRPLVYTDYVRPVFTLSGPLIFREGTGFSVFGPVGAWDVLDGSLTSRIKGSLVSGESMIEHAGMYEVEFRATNSLGETIRLTLPVEIAPYTTAERRLVLSKYLVYLPRGSAFAPGDYLAEGSGRWLSHVDSNVNTAEPGTYAVTYHDVNGSAYGKTRLIVVVEG